jgi:molybdopterin synthase catalytic subunit
MHIAHGGSSWNGGQVVLPQADSAQYANNGGMNAVRLVEVVDRPLDFEAMKAAVRDDRAGAVVTFSGDVRNHDHGRSVERLTYEGHPSAGEVLQQVAESIAAEFDLIALAVAHRVGDLAVGDAALIAIVSSAHRDVAFAACTALVDRTKELLPVWKHQVFTDGTDEWVNCA